MRIKPPLDLPVLNSRLSSVKQEICERYPEHQEKRRFAGGFKIKDGQPVIQLPVDLGIHAHYFYSTDRLQLVQFRRDGFTFNRLKPYTCWESVISEAKELWDIYYRNTSLKLVSRIAVRYINHLNIPLPINDLRDYLTAAPSVPQSTSPTVSTFLMRVVVHDLEKELDANIMQAMEISTKPDFVTIIIDIDAYKSGEFDIQTEEIWAILEQLRHLKNTIFFSSITGRTARLFA